MSKSLTQKKCVPCEGGVPKLSSQEAVLLLKELRGWMLNPDRTAIRSDYVMKDFQAALEFVNAVGALAEEENHHPDIHLTSYRKLAIELYTHAIGGLSENDFILAAKIDKLPKRLKT